MAIIIQFPGNDDRLVREYRELLQGINIPSEEIRQCVLDALAPALVKYGKTPTHSFSLAFPHGTSEAEAKKFGQEIQDEVKKFVWEIQKPMLIDICRLHVELCKAQHR